MTTAQIYNYDIAQARKAIDAPDRLRDIAVAVKKQGEDELAEALYREANRLDMAYDEARDNEL